MQKHFYSHLVEIESLTIEVDKLELSSLEKQHLIELVHANLHHAVLDTILSELSHEDKKTFLIHLTNEDHKKIWSHLTTLIDDIENKIKKIVEKIKEDMLRDIADGKTS